MTERGDVPAGSGPPEGGAAPSSGSEILRRLREKSARGELAPPSSDVDPSALVPPDLSPPDLTSPIFRPTRPLGQPDSQPILSAAQRSAERDRLAAEARAAQAAGLTPTEPSIPGDSGRRGIGRFFGGFFGGGGGGGDEPPGGSPPPDEEPDDDDEPQGPKLRGERIIDPDAKPWTKPLDVIKVELKKAFREERTDTIKDKEAREERKLQTMRFILEEVDVVPRERRYGLIKEAYEALKAFYAEDLAWKPEDEEDFHRKTVKELITEQKAGLESWQNNYRRAKEMADQAMQELAQARQLMASGQGDASELEMAQQNHEETAKNLRDYVNKAKPNIKEARTKQIKLGANLLAPAKLTEIHNKLIAEGLTAGDDRNIRAQQLLQEEIEKEIGAGGILPEDIGEALTGVAKVGRKNLWDNTYGTLRLLHTETAEEIEESLTAYWEYIESPIQVHDPQRVIGDLQQIRAQVVKAHLDNGVDGEAAEAIADNADFWLGAVLNERFARVGDKGNRAALLGYVSKERFRSRLKSLYQKGIGGYDPAMFTLGTYLISERGYSTLLTRPEGPRFELKPKTDMHDWTRSTTRKSLTEELALYDMKPTAQSPVAEQLALLGLDSDEGDEISIRLNTKKMGWGMPKSQFEAMFVRRKREEFTKEEWDMRLEEAKKVSRLAQLYNAFMGNQAEMHLTRMEAENGDAVIRRHEEYFAKYAVIRQIEYDGLSPIDVQRALTEVSSSARTPRLYSDKTHEGNKSHKKVTMYQSIIDRAIHEVEKNGNNATWTYKWRDENGKEHTITEKIEDIIQKDEVRLLWDGYVANDTKLRAAYLSDEVADQVRANMRIRPDKRPNFGTVNPLAMIRKIMDPKLELRSIGATDEELHYCAEALDFSGRLQTEVGQAVMLSLLGKKDKAYLGAQGYGPFADSHVYGMRDGLLNAPSENIKYMERMVAFLPEIFALPTTFGCLRLDELSQLVYLQDPNQASLIPEVFEDWSGELRGEEYQVQTAIRELCMSDYEKDASMRKGFFYEPLVARDQIEHTAHDVLQQIEGNTTFFIFKNDTKVTDDKADAFISNIIKNHLGKLTTLTALTIKLMTGTRKMSAIGSGNWAAGIIYDYWFDRMTAHDDSNNTDLDQDPVTAYGSRHGHEITTILGALLIDSENKNAPKPLRDLAKQKIITTAAKYVDPKKRYTTQASSGH